MRKTVAVYVEKAVVWEARLGPFAPELSDEQLLEEVKKLPWNALFDGEEPEGWRNFKMEIRTY